MLVSEFDQKQSEIICKLCGSQGVLEKRVNGTRLGTWCKLCDAWNDWLHPFATVASPPMKAEPPPERTYTPNQIAHPQTLEERVASLEHDLGVLAQIVMGGRGNAK